MLNSKKGELIAFQELLIIILSVIAIVMIFSQLGVFLLSSPDNEEVAKKNAKGITEFVAFSDESPGDSCTYLLRLYNLQNFQYEKEDENYFFLIKKGEIKMYPLAHFLDFYDKVLRNKEDFSEFEERVPIESFSFEREVKLYEDASFVLSFIPERSLEETQALFLVPKLNEEFINVKLPSSIFIEAQNQYLTYTYNEGYLDQELDSNYLVLRKKGDDLELFFPDSSSTIDYVQNELCSFKLIGGIK